MRSSAPKLKAGVSQVALTHRAYQVGKKSIAQLSTKPLKKRLDRLNRITLKSFNTLAHQIQQSLSTPLIYTPNKQQHATPHPNATRDSACMITPKRDDETRRQSSKHIFEESQTNHRLNQVEGHHAVGEVGTVVEQDDDYYDWGSDFDDQSSLDSTNCEHQVPESSCYLLEIGRACSDVRAMDDVIQDRGISGQFKQLAEQQVQPTSDFICAAVMDKNGRFTSDDGEESLPVKMSDGNETDDSRDDLQAVELQRSPQGFKQIRDKLKIILDQRLADTRSIPSSSIPCRRPEHSEAKLPGTKAGLLPMIQDKQTLAEVNQVKVYRHKIREGRDDVTDCESSPDAHAETLVQQQPPDISDKVTIHYS